MTEGEDGFLRRWSRRKQEAREGAEEPRAEAAPPPDAPAEEEEFDVASLPPLESLGAGSDYTAFLKPGVPKALRLAALRTAWASDPAITGYKTLADYDWDFNAPGYGRLRPTDDPKRYVEALFRHLRPKEEGPPAEPAPELRPAPEVEPRPDESPAETPRIAAAPEEPLPAAEAPPEPLSTAASEDAPTPVPRRRHGGAMPT